MSISRQIFARDTLHFSIDPHVGIGRSSTFHAAIEDCNLQVIYSTIKHDRDVVYVTNSSGRTPLHTAAKHGRASVVALLIRLGCSIDELDFYGWSPLHCAADGGHANIVEILVHAGSKTINRHTRFNQTPMHLAIEGKHFETVKTLFRLGSISAYKPGFFRAYTTRGYKACTPMLTYLGVDIMQSFLLKYEEEKASAIRYDVYFRLSLLQRCLDFPISRSPFMKS